MYSTAQNSYSNNNSAHMHISVSDHTVDDGSNFADTDQSSGYSSSPTIGFAVLSDSEAPSSYWLPDSP